LNDTALHFLDSHFTNKKYNKPVCCFFKIIIPKNTRILYLDTNIIENIRISSDRRRNDQLMLKALEYEVLLPRSSVLKYINSYTINGEIPTTCHISDVKKGKINDIYVYEFEYLEIDKNREIFNLKKMKDISYLEKLLQDIVNIDFFFAKYDFIYQLKTKDIESIIKKTKELERRKRIK
jgi:hypothetical protein